MKKIHIAVACHKKSRLPNNALLVPVQVGAAGAKQRMDMAHDDDGINISEKNSSYCELTAQYWEWKNVEADYYGLCHYRRFLCFKHPEKVKKNDRDHIVAEVIDDENIERFGLNDDAGMRRIIEDSDAIVGEYEQIKRLYTPRGKQTTAYKHWTACDRALIHIADLERMLEILTEVNPEIGADTREYLEGTVFTGFNCFILRKDLFDELCSMEFEVLERLEKEVDLSRYSTQCSRIYGFMGEIISSAYLYHLEKTGKYRVKHVPILFFNYTEDESLKAPEGSINALFYFNYNRVELFSVLWNSFLSNLSAERKYHALVCIRDTDPFSRKLLLEMAESHENLTVQFVDLVQIEKQVNEHYFQGTVGTAPALPMLPYYLKDCSEILVFTENTIINQAIDALWDMKLAPGKVIAAPLDTLKLAQVNDIFPETAYDYLKGQMKDPYQFHGIHCMKVNLDAYREKYSPEELKPYYFTRHKLLRRKDEILNIAFEGAFETISQEWGTWYDSSWYLKRQLAYAPKALYQETMAARKNAIVVAYEEKNPWDLAMNEVTQLYWGYASKTPFYEYLLAYRSSFQNQRTEEAEKRKHHVDLSETLFPKGSKRYKTVLKIMPKDGKLFKKAKETLAKFNME